MWIDTHGRAPQLKDQPYFVRFRNGHESRWPYTAKQLRWTDTGCDWDVVAVRKAAA